MLVGACAPQYPSWSPSFIAANLPGPVDRFLPRLLEPVLLDAVSASQSSPTQIRDYSGDHEPPLSAPLRLSFDYTRSVGTVLSRFFTELRGRHVVGVRGSDGRVHVPPAEFDPVTYERLTEIVPVAKRSQGCDGFRL